MGKLNLTQQKHTFTNKKKCTTTQNKHKTRTKDVLPNKPHAGRRNHTPWQWQNGRICCWMDMSWAGHFPPWNCPYVWGSGPPSDTFPWAHPSPHPKQLLDWFSIFLHSSRQEVAILYNGPPLPPPLKIVPCMGDLNPHLMHGSLGPTESTSQMASRWVQLFLQSSRSWHTNRQTILLHL